MAMRNDGVPHAPTALEDTAAWLERIRERLAAAGLPHNDMDVIAAATRYQADWMRRDGGDASRADD